MFCYEDFKKLPIDHSAVGLLRGSPVSRGNPFPFWHFLR